MAQRAVHWYDAINDASGEYTAAWVAGDEVGMWRAELKAAEAWVQRPDASPGSKREAEQVAQYFRVRLANR